MNTKPDLLTDAFRILSAKLGSDPLQVQGPGGNTSIKADGVMWIKASGTELADALEKDIFVAVDHEAAKAEAYGAGDGSCKTTGLDPSVSLRPSIEITFHAALDWPVVVHTHSVNALTHAISNAGIAVLREKLAGLPYVVVPYAKPGLPLTNQILERVQSDTRIIVLRNHGLICCGATVEEVAETIETVERRIKLPVQRSQEVIPAADPRPGYVWAEAESWLALDTRVRLNVGSGSYYPDHVVFLGPALLEYSENNTSPAVIERGIGVLIKEDAKPSQKAMLRCLSDVFKRLPEDWDPLPIGIVAETELLDWDAEKYRQKLSGTSK